MQIPRSQLQQMAPQFYINNLNVKPSTKVPLGSLVTCTYYDLPELDITPEYVPLDILYEDANTLVINKAQGIVVHPAPGHYHSTLIQGVLYHCKEMAHTFDADSVRPGIVHRLDKDTSGVIIMGKNPASRDFLAAQFKNRVTKKIYRALVHGSPTKKRGVVEAFHKRHRWDRQKFSVSNQGKEAITEYRVIESFKTHALMEFYPKTGRTHQIRVHAKHLGHPIVGDPIYGARKEPIPATLMLHALQLTIQLIGEESPRTFEAPMPSRFGQFIDQCGF